MVAISILLSFFMQSPVTAKAYCSLRINVVDSDRRPLYAYVTVVEPGGRTIEKEHEPGGVEFCDLGIMPVRVEVHPISISCKWMFSEVVELAWGKQKSETIVVPSDPCKYRVPNPLPQCVLLFRTKDEDGNWIGQSKIELLTPTLKSLTTDAHGRALLTVPIGSPLTGMVSAQHYLDARFHFNCTDPIVEHAIELKSDPRLQP